MNRESGFLKIPLSRKNISMDLLKCKSHIILKFGC